MSHSQSVTNGDIILIFFFLLIIHLYIIKIDNQFSAPPPSNHDMTASILDLKQEQTRVRGCGP